MKAEIEVLPYNPVYSWARSFGYVGDFKPAHIPKSVDMTTSLADAICELFDCYGYTSTRIIKWLKGMAL